MRQGHPNGSDRERCFGGMGEWPNQRPQFLAAHFLEPVWFRLEVGQDARLHRLAVPLRPRHVALVGIDEQVVRPVGLDQGVHQARRVPEMDVLVDQAVDQEQPSPEPVGVGQGGGLAIAVRVVPGRAQVLLGVGRVVAVP